MQHSLLDAERLDPFTLLISEKNFDTACETILALAEGGGPSVFPDGSVPALECPCPISIHSFGTTPLDSPDRCTRGLTAFLTFGAFIALGDVPQERLECMRQSDFYQMQ